MKTLSLQKMESINGGEWGASEWLELSCVAGGIGLSFATGGAFALVASLTIHACVGYFATKVYI